VTSQPKRPARERPGFQNLGRAIRFLGHYRNITLAAYVALFLSTGAQLLVPQLLQNILDAVTRGMMAQQLSQAPADVQAGMLAQAGMTAAELDQILSNPLAPLYWAIALILVLAVVRGFFAFAQSYMSEKAGQSVAFDFRNDLFAKIQRLSFSYHDRNRTGQLMIRATDDVEKVRIFIGRGCCWRCRPSCC
jgi:ATP-binding cassette subfamily B multidrug efflux pump